MQAAFFKLAHIISEEDAISYLKQSIEKTYGKKGQDVVEMNYKAVEAGFTSLVKIDVPAAWENVADEEVVENNKPDFIKNIVEPINRQEGDHLPVSAFNGYEDGTFPAGTAAYEKRGVGIDVPEWNIDTCIQCNQCSFVCPHACIRPVLVSEDEMKDAPEGFEAKKAVGKGLEGLVFRMQVSTMDCTGCGNCVDICPTKVKSLVMKPLATQVEKEIPNWEFAVSDKVAYKGDLVKGTTVKDSQFKTPLMEFSGACAGCGETPYMKLLTQLFGDRMMIANATGCSSIWGGSAPSTPYTTNHEGKGPAWANSLFEDNAEYGLGMMLAVNQMRDCIAERLREIIALPIDEKAKESINNWLENKENGELSKVYSREIEAILDNDVITLEDAKEALKQVEERRDYLVKRSQWIIGGDGWAYDIGYGGLDHVLASGENINVLVFDTEIYSNTGGQSSKSTPMAAMAKFAAAGKRTRKKDLGRMMMAYGNVYVAQVAMGADKNQLVKAMLEAEAYEGPSIIIAYATCISHGLKAGMGKSISHMGDAVKSGYWHLYRYNPLLEEQGKNPFTLDSKEPTESFRDFIMGQVRYSAIKKQYPEQAEELFEMAEKQAKDRLASYKRLAAQEF